MLRTITWFVIPSLRLQTSRSLPLGVTSVNGYKSQYSLDKLYPNSNLDYSVPYSPASSNSQESDSSAEFSGHIPIDKLTISYSRSSGPGGQNVNKVNSKVDVRFNVQSAEWIPQNLRNKILEKFKTKINAKGELIVTSDSTRAQIRNLRDCMQKIRDIIEEANKKPKPLSDKDRATIRMRAERYHRERLRLKKIHSVKKDDRHVYLD